MVRAKFTKWLLVAVSLMAAQMMACALIAIALRRDDPHWIAIRAIPALITRHLAAWVFLTVWPSTYVQREIERIESGIATLPRLRAVYAGLSLALADVVVIPGTVATLFILGVDERYVLLAAFASIAVSTAVWPALFSRFVTCHHDTDS